METGNIVDGESEDKSGSSGLTFASKIIGKKPKFPTLKFGCLWGFQVCQQDFEKYLIYFIITNATFDCEFDTIFASWLLVNSFITFPGSLISGWVTDYTSKKQNRTVQISVLLQTVFQLVMILLSAYRNPYSLALMSFAYQLRQAAIVQSGSSIWKLVKIHLEINHFLSQESERNPELENAIVSKIGNYGDMVADCSEIIFLGIAYLITNAGYISFNQTFIAMSCYSMGLNCMVLFISFTFRDIPDYLQSKKQIPQEKHDSDEEEITVDELNTEEEVKRILPTKSKTTFIRKCKDVYYFLAIRFGYLIRASIVLHTLLHAMLGLVVYSFVEYPIALGEADDNASTENRDPISFCGGYLTNLLMQGAMLNIAFLIGAILYGLTLVKCPPKTYYKWVLPILILSTALIVGLLLLDVLPHYATSILVAAGQIIPYYTNAYDYYVFTTYAKEEYYGFLYALYNFLTQVIYNITAIVLSNEIPLSTIIISCVALSGLSFFYGIFIYRKFKAGEGALLK
jgi:hypothetical protein